jgi:hypothetical protein
MRMVPYILALFATSALAQVPALHGPELKHYHRISKRSQSAPDNDSYSTYFLAKYLTDPANTELTKIRSIYVWMAHNITYDMKGFKAKELPDYRPKAVLNSKIAVCEGYARLFSELCNEAGIRSEIIRGYSKGYGYNEGDKFEVTNHAWNAVFLAGHWKFIDVTWAARKSNDSRIVRTFSNQYFLTPPKEFIQNHLPEIPSWQLLSDPVSKEDFEENSININSGTFNYQDSLAMLLNMNISKKAIAYQLKARKFNPHNDDTNYKLGVEYRFRALDSLEAVYKVTEYNMDRFNQLEKQVFADLDEAALYFNLIKPSSRYYKKAQIFLDDTDFERGVFNYEIPHRLLEIYATFSDEKKKDSRAKYEADILQYYQKAGEYFALIPTHSWYYEKAQDYINIYLNNPFEGI